MVFLPNIGVNRRDRLYGVTRTTTAQFLDFLDPGKNPHFWIGNFTMYPFLKNN